MMSVKAWSALALGALLLTGLAACNRNQSAASNGGDAPATDRGSGQGYASAESTGGGDRPSHSSQSHGYGRSDEGEDRPPVPQFHGEPMWSENRSHSAKENAEYHFERAGADLGSHTLDDFLTKVHRFCDHPPAGTQHLTRKNGDRLLYDPKSNLFAVVTAEGAPRTVFKPNDGMAYWTEQKAREAEGGSGDDSGYRRRRSYRREEGGDSGGRSGGYSSDRYGSDRDER